MKPLLFYILFIIAAIHNSTYISGQTGLNKTDSFAIGKPKINENVYRFFDSGDKEIQFGPMTTELVPYKTKVKFRDFTFGVITTLAGLGSSSSIDVNWKISGKIKCNDSLPDWMVSLFCEGYIREERVVVKEDGSRTEEINETYGYYWDKDAGGILTENYDTIGLFLLFMNPHEYTLTKSWSVDLFPQHAEQIPSSKIRWTASWKPTPGSDYGIAGRFREKDFILIRNGTDRKVYIYMDNSIICMFQSDLDYPGMSKKYRIIPYLIIDKDIPAQNRRDLFRLATMSRCISIALDSQK